MDDLPFDDPRGEYLAPTQDEIDAYMKPHFEAKEKEKKEKRDRLWSTYLFPALNLLISLTAIVISIVALKR